MDGQQQLPQSCEPKVSGEGAETSWEPVSPNAPLIMASWPFWVRDQYKLGSGTPFAKGPSTVC